MPYKTITTTTEVHAVDIPTMREMAIEDYDDYLRGGLLQVDHHEVLRSEPAGYPIATTREQVEALIAYLKEIAPSIGEQ
jgi:hypothetical protein